MVLRSSIGILKTAHCQQCVIFVRMGKTGSSGRSSQLSRLPFAGKRLDLGGEISTPIYTDVYIGDAKTTYRRRALRKKVKNLEI